jgi:hypothetical protein
MAFINILLIISGKVPSGYIRLIGENKKLRPTSQSLILQACETHAGERPEMAAVGHRRLNRPRSAGVAI